MIIWLWVDEKRKLLPKKNSQLESLFTYPLLEAYQNRKNTHYVYLNYLIDEQLIRKESLINKIRNCSKCDSGHLNYVETCNSCNSINIEEVSSLHCFNCGHVNNQELFLKINSIECPNCYSKLKHIGLDYDRPIENFHCKDCDHKFSNAETCAFCLSCDHQNDINNLKIHHIYEYGIGNKANELIKFGIQYKIPELNIEGQVNLDYFINMLEWINKISIRHQQEHLFLALSIKQKKGTIQEAEIIEITKEITTRFNDLLRNTDICCQPKEEVLFLFLPMTNECSISVIENKIKKLEKLINDDNFKLIVNIYELPQKKQVDNIDKWINYIIEEIDNE